jgi:excinuclease ABC subunit C
MEKIKFMNYPALKERGIPSKTSSFGKSYHRSKKRGIYIAKINKNKIDCLPKKPGIYAFFNKKDILYLGKAINIKERVKNHFQNPTYKDNVFINKTDKLGFIETSSDIEALILEAKLIKKYQPKFNVVWRDDKNYFYVCFTKENFPRVFITHQIPKNNSQNQCAGPFVDGKAIKQTLKILRKTFPYRNCQKLPQRPCLWYQLKRCPAPCLLKSNLAKQLPKISEKTKKESQKNISGIIKILEGKKEKLLENLKEKMKKASKLKKFEEAGRLRDQISSLERTLAHSIIFEKKDFDWPKIENSLKQIFNDKKDFYRIEAFDISNFQGKEAVGSLVVFIEGKPDKNHYRKFKIKFSKDKPNDTLMIREIIKRRFKHQEWPLPDLALIDGGKGQLNSALREIRNKKVKIMALAKKNNELFLPHRKKPILLKKISPELSNLILRVRDEAHRFAISYHRKLRKNKLFS